MSSFHLDSCNIKNSQASPPENIMYKGNFALFLKGVKNMKRISLVFICILFLLLLSIFASAVKPSQKEIIKGIDVSRYQGTIDFKQVKESGTDIVYIRSSLGSGYVDPYFNKNYNNAKEAGLKVGFYHFVTAMSVAQANQQAAFFVSTIQGKTPDCRLAVDFEDFKTLTKSQINEITLAFAQKVEELSGKEVVIYANSYAASYTLSKAVTKYPLWVAHWGVSAPSNAVLWDEWVGWQYTSSGKVIGVNTLVDKNYFTSDIFLKDKAPVSPESNQGDETIYYVVQKGDTLWAISIKNKTTVEQIVSLNNIKNANLIYAGQRLIINKSSNLDESKYTFYTVKKGDNLWSISKKYGTTVVAIARDNNIKNANLIYAGQTLKIYSALVQPTPQKPPQQSQKTVKYTIKKGDTLWEISKKYGTTVSVIARDNNIKNANRIYAGQQLTIKIK